MAYAYISIGSNIERERNVGLAILRLRERYGRLKVSGIYESAPVGFEGDPFYNVVVGLSSDDSISDLVDEFQRIEEESGRARTAEKFGPRTLDIDLLLYGDLIYQRNGLKLPRDEVTRFAFVLAPLAEIAGDLHHPVVGKTIGEIWSGFDDSAQPVTRLSQSTKALEDLAINHLRSAAADDARGRS